MCTIRIHVNHLVQDAVLFAGTVRTNIDPFEEYDDKTLWNALDTAHLGDQIRGLATDVEPNGLHSYVANSVLLCLFLRRWMHLNWRDPVW